MVVNKDWLIITLVIGLIVVSGCLAYFKYSTSKAVQDLEKWQEGAQYGNQATLLEIVQQAVTCKTVPITVGNQTINLIAVECLQQDQEEVI